MFAVANIVIVSIIIKYLQQSLACYCCNVNVRSSHMAYIMYFCHSGCERSRFYVSF